MPKSDNFKKLASHAVIEKVTNSREIQPANDVGASRLYFGANARLFNNQGQRRFNVQSNSANGGRPIFGPPLCCSFNLALRAGLDSDNERQD
jgi:hypothetical protein